MKIVKNKWVLKWKKDNWLEKIKSLVENNYVQTTSDLENSFIFFSSSRILHSMSSYPLTESSNEFSAYKSD